MKTEIKAKWLDALRSGDYEQGTMRLRSRNDRFCCLGVLCDIAEKEGIVTATLVENMGDWRYFGPARPDDALAWVPDSATTLPDAVVEWAELGQNNPDIAVTPDGPVRSLAGLNDSGFPFSEIADLIEEHL